MDKRMITIAGGMLIGGLSLGLLPAAGPPAPQPTKWEYTSVNQLADQCDELNKLSADGWELVSVTASEYHNNS